MDDKKVNALIAVYSFHKKEIMTRRLLEYVTGTSAMLFYGFILLYIWARRLPDGLNLGALERGIGTIGLVVVADVTAYFLIKNHRRQCDLKRAVAKIDDALGLFTPGEYVAGESIYPADWKKHGEERAMSNVSRLMSVLVLALITIAVLWLS